VRVLVFGGSGMLGHKLAQILASDFEVFSTLRSNSETSYGLPVPDSERVVFAVSADNLDSVAHAINDLRPEVAVNCIGIVKQLQASRDPIPAISVNALFPHRLAQLCAASGTRLVQISTDCVFSGERGGYSEDDPADADDLYGRTKFLGELAGEHCMTIRTSMIGRELRTSNGLVEWFLGQNGGSVNGYRKSIFSGFTTRALASVIGRIISEHPDLEGVWHVAADPISKFDLLALIRDTYQLDIEINPDEEFVCDRSLNGQRFRTETGFSPPSWGQMIREMQQDRTPYDEIRRLHAHR
jgi:dTDP-4-dehydrorhamnose reductase